MTTTTVPAPTHTTPVALARGFLTGGVSGVALAALVVGVVIESVPLFVTGLGLPVVYGVLLRLAGAPRRAREAAVVPRTALAMIESLRARSSETGDIPIDFVLTVAPDDSPAFRVEITQAVNLVDLPDYRPRGILVVEYPTERPWRTRIVQRPTPEWEGRAAEARMDSAPESAVVKEPPEGCAFGTLILIGLVLGAAAVVLLFRADLFDPADSGKPSASPGPSSSRGPSVSSSTSSTTVTTSSMSATVALGPGQSLLDKGELRRSVASLTKEATDSDKDGSEDKDAPEALTVVVQERLLSVVFAPTGTAAPRFDLDSLPYDRIPALVQEARTTLGVGSPQTWQLTADELTGSLTLRVTVTGPDGGASLDADAHGKVLRRSPAS
ncbi:hypothetical protein [Streptomyces sp. NBC_01314]|uniref:hypothetical protein n=1 Tax=Streptomyces sp. NBC_01314 TaxID=2903821 RepID=UPI00308EED4F|nr:hypothetical protein OG622_05575 [Streptomyces sp. NBC_01314]